MREFFTDCKHFRGDEPCVFYKETGIECSECSNYIPLKEKILIIKLGAIGDVIRTTPLLVRIRKDKPNSQIFWLTQHPDFLPDDLIDVILTPNVTDLAYLFANKFDIIYNLDKAKTACAITQLLESNVKKGFVLDKFGRCTYLDEQSKHKWLTGISDSISRRNNLSYLEEIFQICGFQYQGEKYKIKIISLEETSSEFKSMIGIVKNIRHLIGINTGCSNRWPTRLWPEEYFVELCKLLKKKGMFPLLLGGPQEDGKNKRIAQKSEALYFGVFPLVFFPLLIKEVDILVTVPTMALHLGLALEKKIILLNNIFNKNEFELFGKGKILEPDVECKGCYKRKCDRECMRYITPSMVYQNIESLIESTDEK